MADNEKPQEQATSAAKEYEPQALEGTSLGDVPSSKPSFEQACSTQDGPTRSTVGQGSEQVKGEGNRHDMHPPEEMRRGPDQAKHIHGMMRDDELVQRQAKIDRIKRAQVGLEQGRDGLSKPGRDL